MINKVNHIGIAVEKIEDQLSWYRDVLGMELVSIEEVKDQKVRVALLAVGNLHIELLEPTQDDGPVAKFLAKNKPGIHHISYEVDNVNEAIEQLEKNDIRMIDKTPRDGAHNTKIAFVHPKSAGGILTELCALKTDRQN